MLTILVFTTLAFAGVISSCEKPYCESCSSVDSCDSCIIDYILLDGECKFKRDLHCEKFVQLSNDFECIDCADGYKHNNVTRKCEEGKEICLTDNIDKYECDNCVAGYVKGSSGCKNCSITNKYCWLLEGDDCLKCKRCLPGTKKNSETGVCDIFDEFCQMNDEEENCIECHGGYYLSTDGKCKKGNIQNCEVYETEDKCKECFGQTTFLNNGSCVYDSNCLEMDNSKVNTCKTCKNGFGLVDKLCKKCEAKNCKTCNNDITKCDSCSENLLIYNSNCESCAVESCLKCSSDDINVCNECKQGFRLKDDGTVCEECTAKNCSTCELDSGICTTCLLKNQFIYDSNCVECPVNNCETCVENSIEKCDECKEGYMVNADGQCEKCSDVNCGFCNPKEKCTICKTGYGITSEGSCSKCSEPNCESCNGDTNSVCEHCASNFVNIDGHCVNKIDHCYEHTVEGNCNKCNYGYILNENKCYSDNCKSEEREENGRCGGCIKGYYLTNTYTCEKCDEKCTEGCVNDAKNCESIFEMRSEKNCKFFSKDHVCLECSVTFHFENGKCVDNIKECSEPTFTNKCTMCTTKDHFDYLPNDDFVCVEEEESLTSNGNESEEDDGGMFLKVIFMVVIAIILI